MSSKRTKRHAKIAAHASGFSSEVEHAKKAFELGNYHQVRKIAKKLASDHDEKGIEQVNDLLTRSKIDPKVIMVGAFTLLFLFAIGLIVLN